MAIDQTIVTAVVALIAASGGYMIERLRGRREKEKEVNVGVVSLQQAQITDEALKRKELDDTARETRGFLRTQVAELTLTVAELNETVRRIELERAAEREQFHIIFGKARITDLEAELQHRRDVSRIQELEEEALSIDDRVQILKTRIVTTENELTVVLAQFNKCKSDCEKLQAKLDAANLAT